MAQSGSRLKDQTLVTIEALQAIMDRLQAQGAEGFDPSRFQLLLSMLTKAEGQRDKVQALVLNKAFNVLEQFQSDFQSAQGQASLQADQLEYAFPDQHEAIQALYRQGNYSALTRLGIKLRQDAGFQSGALENLKALTRHLSAFSREQDGDARAESVQALLQDQEQSIRAKVLGESDMPVATDDNKELYSIRVLRDFQKRQQIDDLVDQAVRNQPDNPGPINPHMLAIKSLVSMREISQPYLDHFVEYLDTLFALESQFEK